MDDQKDYGDVFYKDDRNRHQSHNGNKGMNYKAVMKRQIQMAKRQHVQTVEVSPDKQQQEVPEKSKKYGNGKPKRQIKEQQAYIDSDPEEDKKNKKNKKVKKAKN